MAGTKISDATTTTPVGTDMIPFERVADATARHMTGAAYLAWFCNQTLVFNESGADVDFRFEGGNEENLLVLDGGNDNITIGAAPVSAHYDLMLARVGVLGLKETTTPTADINHGKVYTKTDNILYFQDGAGAEHDIAIGSELNLGTMIEKTLDSNTNGVIATAGLSSIKIDTYDDQATGDLETINGGTEGDILVIRAAVGTRTIVVKHNADNVFLRGAADVDLDDLNKFMLLFYSPAGKWHQFL